MADFYIWNATELGLQIQEMDKEHQELINKMNSLYSCVEQKQPAPKIEACLTDLANYTVKHFSDEEAYMAKIGFAGISTHKIIHQQLLTQFKGHVEEFKKSKTLSPEFFKFLKVWLTGHIRGIDKKYSDFKHQKAA